MRTTEILRFSNRYASKVWGINFSSSSQAFLLYPFDSKIGHQMRLRKSSSFKYVHWAVDFFKENLKGEFNEDFYYFSSQNGQIRAEAKLIKSEAKHVETVVVLNVRFNEEWVESFVLRDMEEAIIFFINEFR